MSRATRESSSATFDIDDRISLGRLRAPTRSSGRAPLSIWSRNVVRPAAVPQSSTNKRETQNKKQNCEDIEDHSRPRCNVFEPFVSFDQSYHPAPLYAVKGVHKVAPIEHGKETFHRSLRVP